MNLPFATSEEVAPFLATDRDMLGGPPEHLYADQVGADAPEVSPPGLPRPGWDSRLRVRIEYNPDDQSPDNNFGRFAIGGAMQDFPTGIVTGGTAEILFRSNKARRYLLIQNLDATETLWVRPGGRERPAAVGVGFALNAAPAANQGGGTLVMEGTAISTDEWTVFATTTGHRFYAMEL